MPKVNIIAPITKFLRQMTLSDAEKLTIRTLTGSSGYRTAASAPVDGFTAGDVGEEILVDTSEVYKCVATGPTKFVRISEIYAENLSALRAVSAARLRHGAVAKLRYHTSSADAGGGTFLWDSAFTGINNPDISPGPGLNVFDDNGTFIKPTSIATPISTPGRWRRAEALALGPGVVHVRWWGAVPYFRIFYGAATPWVSGTVDSWPAFQAAADALPTSNYTVGELVSPTGRERRTGKIIIDPGQFWLSDTWYVSSMVNVVGSGSGQTTLIRMPNTAPAAGGESFVVCQDDPGLANNNFDSIISDLAISGYAFGDGAAVNGNGGVSGLYWHGAQGSYIKNLKVGDCIRRGVVQTNTACPISDTWIYSIWQGPGLYVQSFGQGFQYSNLSVEHVNTSGTHVLTGQYLTNTDLTPRADRFVGVKCPAVLLDGLLGFQFDCIQGEASHTDLILSDCIWCDVNYILSGGGKPSGAKGVLLINNSYHNKFGTVHCDFEDQSELAVAAGINGNSDPYLIEPGTWKYKPLWDVASNAAKLSRHPGSVPHGQLMRMTGEGNRLERFVGTGTQNSDPAMWEVVETRTSGPHLDIRNYGAVAGTDCTAAIQTALDVGIYSNGTDDFAGNSVFIPRGQWLLSAPLRLHRGSVLFGVGDWDQGGSELKMVNGANCSAIETPSAHSGQSPTQYMRVTGLRIVGNRQNQTVEAPAINWSGVYVGSVLDYIFIADWYGPSIVVGSTSDTSISRIWSVDTVCSTYAIQVRDATITTGYGGFILLEDIYCEVVKKPNGNRGNAFLFNRAVSLHARGLHTEYVACPITIRDCQVITIDGFSGYADGWLTDAQTTIAPEGALIYVDGAGIYNLRIGLVSYALKDIAVVPFKASAAVNASTWVFPDTTGLAGTAAWSGCDITNTSISQGGLSVSYGKFDMDYQVVGGTKVNAHPRREMRKNIFDGTNNLFWEEFRVDFNTLSMKGKIGGVTHPYWTAVFQSNDIHWNYFGIDIPLRLSFDAATQGTPVVDNIVYRNGAALMYHSTSGHRNVGLIRTDASAPVDGTTPGLLGEEIIVDGTDVYKCVATGPTKFVRISEIYAENLSALRAVSAARLRHGAVAKLRYHTSSADAGGGTFLWDSAFIGINDPAISAAPTLNVFDDNGTFIKPSSIATPISTPGRWRRAEALTYGPGKVKVIWWGAVPYFRTYYGAATPWVSGTVDSRAAFQAANDALPLAHPDYITPTGRRFRTGVIEIAAGQFWLSDTWYVSPTCRVTGSGVSKTTLIRMPDTAASGESFVIRSEDLTIGINNNNFNNILEELAVCGNSFHGKTDASTTVSYINGNGDVSGVFWAGAQGSYVRNVQITDCGRRGLVQDLTGCNMYDLWVANITQGPGLQFSSYGFGWKHRNLSIEHVNTLGSYYLAGHAGVKSPAVFLNGVIGWECGTLQGEASTLELYMYNCIRCNIPYFGCDGDNGGAQNAILLAGNSYDNRFHHVEVSGVYDTKFNDQTDSAVTAGLNGVCDPALFDGTWMYRPEIDRTNMQTALAIQGGYVHPGQVVRLTEENNRKVRFLGPRGQNSYADYWEDLLGPNSQLTLPAKTAVAITAITVAVAAVVTATGHGLADGAVVNITGSNSTPSIDGLRTITYLTANTFSVAVTTTVSGSAGSINTGVLRVAKGILPLKPQTWLVQTVGNGVQGTENFMASNFWNSDASGSFVLTSIGKSSYFGDLSGPSDISGGMTPTWPYVDLYLISNRTGGALVVVMTLLGKVN